MGLIVEDTRFSEENLAAQALRSLEITADRVRASILETTGAGEAATTGRGAIPFNADGKAALHRALVESQRLGHDHVAPGHVLLGLVHDSDSAAARILLDLGADREKIWVTLRRLFLASHRQPRAGVVVQGALASAAGRAFPGGFQVAFSEHVRRVGMSAAARALDDGRLEVGLPDFLLALTSDEMSVPLLADLGIDVVSVREALECQRGSEDPPQASAEG